MKYTTVIILTMSVHLLAMKDDVKIITLPVARYKEFKQLRRDAVKEAPQAIGGSIASESKRSGQWYMGILEAAQQERTEWFLFAQKEKKLIGMVGAMCKMKHIDEARHMATIVSMYVRPEYRQQGVGSRLMEALLHTLGQSPVVRQAMLFVTATETPAIALYKKHGFEAKGTLADALIVDGAHYDQLIMQRSIDMLPPKPPAFSVEKFREEVHHGFDSFDFSTMKSRKEIKAYIKEHFSAALQNDAEKYPMFNQFVVSEDINTQMKKVFNHLLFCCINQYCLKHKL